MKASITVGVSITIAYPFIKKGQLLFQVLSHFPSSAVMINKCPLLGLILKFKRTPLL